MSFMFGKGQKGVTKQSVSYLEPCGGISHRTAAPCDIMQC